jgi:hypothetical protein
MMKIPGNEGGVMAGKERGFRRAFAAGGLVIGTAVLLLSGCSATRALMEENARLAAENETLRKEVAILRARTEDLINSQPGLTADEKEDYRKRGLKNPADDIVEDLGSREELMPLKGIFGARPSFYSDSRMYILNSKWVFTTWSIGEKTGQQLLEYTVGENGEIHWKILQTLIK